MVGEYVISVVLIAFSLALDAFAVSISSGVSIPGFGWRDALKMGAWFGAFQFFMPLMGWLAGSAASACVSTAGHCLAFGILTAIGGRMLWTCRRCNPEPEAAPPRLSAGRLCLLAVATSIDALAAGVSMAFMEVNILLSACVIGLAAFVLSVVGGRLGHRLGCLFQTRATMAGGLALIGIGIKILLEHVACF
ncbi:MAG: manganese efflux pump [Clostridiales bacterium]|nr:manganese efflux pump [Clostridiales bacterium]